jgi:acyl-coenzyme A synthetase/AMP-(fatty) acid ligase
MESTFGVPVIEAYGMTEAAHQMTSNPLPPQPRYPGCVGIAAGPEVVPRAHNAKYHSSRPARSGMRLRGNCELIEIACKSA